jgi:protein gp37
MNRKVKKSKMSAQSKIEWTDKTWNPVTGCTKVSQGCKHCYAETFYERFHGKGSFKNVICHPDRLGQPLKWKKPSMIFVNSMSDLFHEDVPFEFIDKVFVIMKAAYWHTFQVLTKRADRMLEYFSSDRPKLLDDACLAMMSEGKYDIPSMVCYVQSEDTRSYGYPTENIWLGVSVEDQKAADERIPLLLKVPAAVRFLSCEPLFGEIKLYLGLLKTARRGDQGIHWLICGGESGTGARPMHPDWARSLRDQCKAADVPFFFKQWGEWKPAKLLWYKDFKGRDMPEFDPDAYFPFGVDNAITTGFYFKRAGKKKAGRLLDNQVHDEFPNLKSIHA